MMNKQELEAKVAELAAVQRWNHNILLPNDVETRPGKQVSQGKNLVKWNRISPLLEQLGVRGKRVLDVGCNEGFFVFRLGEMGASAVGIDIDPHRIEKARFAQQALAADDPEFGLPEFRLLDIYSDEFASMPRFDVILCMGFLHRIPDPFSAIQRLVERTDLIVFEWKALKVGPHDEPFARYTPGDYEQQDFYGTQYWVMSYACVEAILERLGFRYFHRVDDPRMRRAILVAGKVDNPIFHQPDRIETRGRLRILLSHTKRYLRTAAQILAGRLNS